MAKRPRPLSSDASDDEAPETVSFGSSKQVARGEQNALQEYHAQEKRKRKDKNRALDRALKERSASAKSSKSVPGRHTGSAESRVQMSESEESDREVGAEAGPSRKELEARMARAMADADDESLDEDEVEDDDELGEDGGIEETDDEEQVDAGAGEEEAESDDEEDDDEDEDEEMPADISQEEEDEDPSPTTSYPSRKKNYLPDAVFQSALSAASKKIVFSDDTPRNARKPSPPPRKRKRYKNSSKDLIIGSRTVRTLPPPTAVASPAAAKGLAPPKRVEKFLKKSLNLKGDAGKSKSKGWSRRPANLGVMRRSGPAANFVRSS